MTGVANAQGSFLISQPEITTCQASLQDTGGEPGGGYQNNENFTTVICPDSPGQGISLNFGATPFNLSTAGTAPLDQLSIWDGPDDTYPLIGTWTGNNSPGIITASFLNAQNTGGCLTVRFTSNDSGTGRFAAFISCEVPCEPPTAVAIIENATETPLLVCQNELITFDASGSVPAQGFSIDEYKWDFDDGVLDSITGPIITHSFPEPGEYVVQVYLTDNNNCGSANLVDLQILVSTTPVFAGTAASDTVICQGTPVVLDANPVQAITWSAIPEADFGNGIYLPDDQSQPFNSSIQFAGFSPNSTLTNISDLLSVCVSMEHSYMGDLVIFLTCPNGQNVYFHQQGGGGTFIGNALDGETDPPTPGECLDYCWDPTATNGTWATNAGGTLPSGSYASVQPMTQLIGCPLNGIWTLTVNDLFGADDGFLCSWQINFDPDLYPDLTEFTPVLGESALDSAIWSGPNVVTDPNDPLVAVVNTPEPGTFDYVFSVTDNFGCTYDTTLTVLVNPSPQGPIVITGDAEICDDGVANLSVPQGFDTYIWSPLDASTSNVSIEEAGEYTVTVAFGDCPYTTDPFAVTVLPNPEPVIVGPPVQCGDQPALLSTQEPYAGYLWSNTSQESTISVGVGQWFVVVTDENGCNGTSAPYTVTSAPNPTAGFSFDPVPPVPVETTVQFTDASTVTGDVITEWEWDFGTPVGSSTEQFPSYTYLGPGEFVVTLVVTTSQGCSDTISTIYTVFPPEILIPNVFTPNGDRLNDTFSIENLRFYGHELKIYSRWGTLVHESTDAAREWKASEQPDGTYYYVLTLEDGRELAGHITVLR
jgi:gliding motility-associated-like protein